MRAVNVNTLDEVPNSSWFKNRIGVRDMPLDEIAAGRSSSKARRVGMDVVRGKNPGGFQPGFRASHAGDPGQVYQLEVDPPKHPQMASGAEFIGTLIYHALGYHVVDVYTIKVDPARSPSPRRDVRDASGAAQVHRRISSHLVGGRDANGLCTCRRRASRKDRDRGRWQYYGTRTDDPNDIHPHEHRRELRGNRVFSAWLAHDDSRAVNTRNILIDGHGRAWSGTTCTISARRSAAQRASPSRPGNNHEYFLDDGLRLQVALLARPGRAEVPPIGRRICRRRSAPSTARRSTRALAAELSESGLPHAAGRCVLGGTAGVAFLERDDSRHRRPRPSTTTAATEYLSKVLAERRDKIARVWLNGVVPIVNPVLAGDGTLTFENAAITAGERRRAARLSSDVGAVRQRDRCPGQSWRPKPV